jgi:tRNA A37 threonylcarbamoyladenosine biosynthesis protein TsaE
MDQRPDLFNPFRNANLTDCQVNALRALSSFFSDDSQSVFLLMGYAGTGKTFLTKGIISWLKQKEYLVEALAPTGRAALVLNRKSGHKAKTIHQEIYEYDLNASIKADGKAVFRLGIREKESAKTVYIVDESSMISNKRTTSEELAFGSGQLLKDLMEFVDLKNYPKTKLIFIGDPGQLPPVGMEYSPALAAKDWIKDFAIVPQKSILKSVVRQQDGSGILQLAHAIRGPLEASQKVELKSLPIHKSNKTLYKRDLIHHFLQLVKRKSLVDTALIVNSNAKALEYNLKIREVLFPNAPGSVQKGDLIMNVQNSYHLENYVMNGETLEVLEIGGSKIVHLTTQIAENERHKIKRYLKPFQKIEESQGRYYVSTRFIFRDLKLRSVGMGTKGPEFSTWVLEHMLFDEGSGLDKYSSRALRADFEQRFRKENEDLFHSSPPEYHRKKSVG